MGLQVAHLRAAMAELSTPQVTALAVTGTAAVGGLLLLLGAHQGPVLLNQLQTLLRRKLKTRAVREVPCCKLLGELPYFPLTAAFPALASKLHVLPLCSYPTPFKPLPNLTRVIAPKARVQVYAKCDDKSAAEYGGNKPRKLELLLAEALRSGAHEVITFGTIGSHSVLANFLHARAAGLHCTAHVLPQRMGPTLRPQALRFHRAARSPPPPPPAPPPPAGHRPAPHATAGTLRFYTSPWACLLSSLYHLAAARLRWGRLPYLIPSGSTSALSTVGYVNAAFELADDVHRGALPAAPTRIYLPIGSGGTFIGLLIGVMACPAFKHTKVYGMRSNLPRVRPLSAYLAHFEETVAFLRALDPAFPALRMDRRHLAEMITADFTGDGYAAPTSGTLEAHLLAQRDEVHLDTTYTAKATAGLVHALRARESEGGAAAEGEVWVLWNTNSSVELPADLTGPATDAEVAEMPRALARAYFM